MVKKKSWKFIPVDEVPRTRRGFYGGIIDDFLASNFEVVKVNCDFKARVNSVRLMLQRATGNKVRVFTRRGEVFLLRLQKKELQK